MQGHRELLHRAGPSKNLQEQQVSQTQFSADRKDLLCFFFFFKNIPFNHQALGNSVERSPHGCLFNKEGGLQDDNEPESQVSDI